MAGELTIVMGIFDFGSGAHWLIILFVALLMFGRKLPEIMKNLGGSIREFKKGMDEGPVTPPQPPPAAQTPVPHIDGAESRPRDEGADSKPQDPANPYSRPDEPPQHH